MRILVTGATGFIGGAVVDALLARGHRPLPAVRDVEAARRRWPMLAPLACDFMHDTDAQAWRPRLAGIDAVVNAVGILRESRRARFEALHSAAPRALFQACADAGVRRVVQVSALGADAQAASAYHLSKRAADEALQALGLQATVVQPSVVFAPQGASAGAFLAMATLPLLALPGGGVQLLAPVHLDDVVDAIVRALESEAPPPRIEAVGPACVPMRDYLARLRRQLGGGPLRVLPVPMPLVRLGAHAMAHVPGSIVDPDTIAMLERGNCAPVAPFAAFLGRAPRAIDAFIAPADATALRTRAQLLWLLPLLRIALAGVFVASGLLLLGAPPAEESRAALARVGLAGATAEAARVAAGAAGLALGFALLLGRRLRRVAYVAAALVLVLGIVIITGARPEGWSHAFGAVLGSVPILAVLALLHALDREP